MNTTLVHAVGYGLCLPVAVRDWTEEAHIELVRSFDLIINFSLSYHSIAMLLFRVILVMRERERREKKGGILSFRC